MSVTGYVRQSAAQISSGLGITSAAFNNEFNQLQAAFSASSGHDHDGTVGGGQPLGPSSFSGLTGSSAGIIAANGSGGFNLATITGTAGKITVTNGSGALGNPTLTIDAAYLGQSSITTLGTIATGVWNGTVITGTYGGTGVNNSSNTITLGGNISTASSFTTSGANPLTLTTTGTTNITLPTSGTLVSSTVTTLSSLNSVGTIGTGTWQATAIGVTYGGTGSNLSATGGTSQVLRQSTVGGAVTVSQLAASNLSDGTSGSGNIALVNTPTLITPVLGVATATSINKITITAPASGSTLTILNGKTLTANNSLTLAGTDGTTLTFQGTDTYVARATTDTLTNKTYDTAGTGNVFKINGTTVSSVTGTGSTAVLSVSPTFTGTPLAPTATGGTNTTQLATTAFVQSALSALSGYLLASNNLSDLGSVTTALTNLGFVNSFSTTEGSVSIPFGANKLIVKWKTNLAAGTNWQAGATWTFASAFPTACVYVDFIATATAPNNPYSAYVFSRSASAVTLATVNSADTFTALAFAIGY